MKKIMLLFFLLFACISIHAQDVILTSLQFEETLYSPASLSIEVVFADYNPGEPAHLNIQNKESGYRKLKLGDNPSSIYSPSVNVSYGGNTILQIILSDVSGTADWSKITFKIIGISGQEVYNQSVNCSEGFNTIHLSTPELNKGVYFLTLTSDNQIFNTEKIIMQ